jgi:hypothetical protein
MTKWRVELHSHTLYSMDSLTSLEAFLRTCESRRLDKVAVTDHNTAEGALRLAQRAPERIIVGEEIMTTEGELLAFFVKESVPPFLSPEETIVRLRQQDAFISVSHPFDRLRKGAWQAALCCAFCRLWMPLKASMRAVCSPKITRRRSLLQRRTASRIRSARTRTCPTSWDAPCWKCRLLRTRKASNVRSPRLCRRRT